MVHSTQVAYPDAYEILKLGWNTSWDNPYFGQVLEFSEWASFPTFGKWFPNFLLVAPHQWLFFRAFKISKQLFLVAGRGPWMSKVWFRLWFGRWIYIYIHTHVCARLELLRQVISTIIWDASPQGFPCPQCPQSLSRPVPCRPSAFRASRTLVARHRWKASSPVGSSMWSISSSNLADG